MVNSMDKKKRRKKRWLIVAVVVLVVLLIAAFIYTPALPEVAKIADQMENVDGDLYFYGNSDVGFIIYPGVKADERSYAYIAQQLNKEGHTVIIPNIPLHMAVYGPEQGLAIMEDNPQIEKWFLIGHSLGGLPISQIAAEQPEKLEGVAFVASLMILDLSNTDISAIRITAEHDGVMPDKMMESNLNYLPENSVSVVIEGANHNQFGAYWHPGFDGTATITWKEQQDQMVALILDFFHEQIHGGSEVGE